MDQAESMAQDLKTLPKLARIARPSVADQVYDLLQHRILTLALPPGAKLSESDVAGQLGVSRQPVREAFQRLAAQGFLLIRPQRSTTVSHISEAAVLRARFIRTALETHTCRRASALLTEQDFTELSALLDRQAETVAANDRDRFHAQDEEFHREICVRAGVGYVWDLILDSKAHMDRIRMLSLNTKSQTHALKEHREILAALMARDAEMVADAMTRHLSRIVQQIEETKAANHDWFAEDE